MPAREFNICQRFAASGLGGGVPSLLEPSRSGQTFREGSPEGERGGANQYLFNNTSDPDIVLFLYAAKPKAYQGKVFLVNASQIFEKGNPKNFIPDDGIQRIADILIGWQEEERLSRVVDHAELKKTDYNISPSRCIHTSDAETYRSIAEIFVEKDSFLSVARRSNLPRCIAVLLPLHFSFNN